MSRNGTLLPIPAGGNLELELAGLVLSWEQERWRWPFRSRWLKAVEEALRAFYPDSSSADRRLTARHIAPFELALGPNVP
jgi:hypothetical protein